MKGNLRRPRLLIFESRDNLEDYKAFERKSARAEFENIKKKANIWDPSKISFIEDSKEEKIESNTMDEPQIEEKYKNVLV